MYEVVQTEGKIFWIVTVEPISWGNGQKKLY